MKPDIEAVMLEIWQRLPLKNDRDGYLHALIEWALADENSIMERTKPGDYSQPERWW